MRGGRREKWENFRKQKTVGTTTEGRKKWEEEEKSPTSFPPSLCKMREKEPNTLQKLPW